MLEGVLLMEETKLDYALNYASIGWSVLPLHFITERGCSCGKKCKSPGKHPIESGGFKQATIDQVKIESWWRKHPNANIGVATGEKSGIFVLDIDPKNGGDDSLDKIEAEYEKVADSVLAITGSKGKHFVFKYPGEIGKCKTELYPGVDTRGDGGYIVVAPSNHSSGTEYFWDSEADPLEGAIPVDAPQWLLQKLSENKPIAKTSVDAIRLSNQEIKRIRAALVYIPADNRDDWLKAGMALHSTNADDQAFGLWAEWSQQSEKFDLSDQRSKWDGFDIGGGLSIASLFALAKSHGWLPVAEHPPEIPIEYYSDELDSGYVEAPVEQKNDELKNRLLSFDEVMARLAGTDYLVKPLLCTKSVGTLFGDSGTMKSFVAIDLGLSIAVGKEFHGFNTRQGAVVYVCGEGVSGIPKRLKAWCIAHEIDHTDIPFFVTKLPIALVDKMDAAAIADDIEKTCKNPALIIVDTLSANFGEGDESSNADMSKLLTNVSIYFREMGSCVLFVHHVGHGDKGRERGAYALRANVDFRIQVEKLTETSPITLRSLKVKDGPIFDPVAFKAKVIPIPSLFDSEGVQETSVVLELDEYEEIPNTPIRGNYGVALSILKADCTSRRKELDKRGSNALAWVPFESWYNLFIEQGAKTRKDSFKRTVTQLVNAGSVIESAKQLYRVPE